MADLNHSSAQTHRPTTTTNDSSSAVFLRKLQDNLHTPNSTQLAGILTLLVTGSIFLLLTGLSVAGTVISLIFFSPLIIVSSPIWVPAGTFFFLLAAGFLSMCGFGVVAVAASSWLYRYFRGLHPPGSDRVDYARSRIYDTASHVKDYAREYGGYLQSKVKDAAPGA
ncbi:oleosin [Trifolium pratense]|uniref:Oleosin n=1 Tax=Trifolium pratense TaxID=57577 RepID=A0A2K3MIG3_TRIPR|nr:oleosin [Trifolium pratense]